MKNETSSVNKKKYFDQIKKENVNFERDLDTMLEKTKEKEKN